MIIDEKIHIYRNGEENDTDICDACECKKELYVLNFFCPDEATNYTFYFCSKCTKAVSKWEEKQRSIWLKDCSDRCWKCGAQDLDTIVYHGNKEINLCEPCEKDFTYFYTRKCLSFIRENL